MHGFKITPAEAERTYETLVGMFNKERIFGPTAPGEIRARGLRFTEAGRFLHAANGKVVKTTFNLPSFMDTSAGMPWLERADYILKTSLPMG